MIVYTRLYIKLNKTIKIMNVLRCPIFSSTSNFNFQSIFSWNYLIYNFVENSSSKPLNGNFVYWSLEVYYKVEAESLIKFILKIYEYGDP